MLTVSSIPAGSAAGYASYLESRTVAPEPGGSYLGEDGAPAEDIKASTIVRLARALETTPADLMAGVELTS